MLPTTSGTLHVRSDRVLFDGRARPATVHLTVHDGIATVRQIAPDERDERAVDLGSTIVAPAPLDLHMHGAGGLAVPPDGDPASIDAVLDDRCRQAGWGLGRLRTAYGWLATLPIPTRPAPDPVAHLAAAARLVAERPDSWCAGLRIEGLFLNPQRAGVWPPGSFVAPDPGLLRELYAAALDGGAPLRIIDVAPELPGALELVTCARELGIVASLAHSDATWEQAVAAIDAGATLATHVWNAMRPVAHRDPGIVAAVLADDRVTCELICDGVHLHPGAIRLSIAACGTGGWVAISDASPFAGCEPGAYDWAGTSVTHDGVALRDPAGRLAGSASLLDVAVTTLRAGGIDDVDVVAGMGAVPRRVLDPTRSIGLEVGDTVWLAAFDATSAPDHAKSASII